MSRKHRQAHLEWVNTKSLPATKATRKAGWSFKVTGAIFPVAMLLVLAFIIGKYVL